MKLAIAAVFALVLAGCQSGPSAYEQDWAYCSKNGASKELDQINACMGYMNSSRQAKAARNSAGMALASSILLSNNRPVPAPTMSMPVNCVTSRNPFGGQVYTTCR